MWSSARGSQEPELGVGRWAQHSDLPGHFTSVALLLLTRADRPREAGWPVAGDSATCRRLWGPGAESRPWKEPAAVLRQSASLPKLGPSALRWAVIPSLVTARGRSAGLDSGIIVVLRQSLVPTLVPAPHVPVQRGPLVPVSLGGVSGPWAARQIHVLSNRLSCPPRVGFVYQPHRRVVSAHHCSHSRDEGRNQGRSRVYAVLRSPLEGTILVHGSPAWKTPGSPLS